MARFSGKGLVVLVENSSASEVAFTHVTEVSIEDAFTSVPMVGDDVQSSAAGQRVSRVTVSYEWDSTATTGNHAVLNGILGDNTNPRFIRVRPIGTGSGLAQFSMDAVLLKHGVVGQSRAGVLMGEAVFENHKDASADPVWANQA